MTFAVVTPSYRNDWSLFLGLHDSVLHHTPEPAIHYVIVPNADVKLFSQLTGPRCVVIPEESLYPSHYRQLPGVNQLLHLLPRVPASARIAAINLRRPFHPVRGWVMQQALKMEVCRQIDADVLLLLDSDVLLVRDVTDRTLRREGHARLYRLPAAVDTHLPQHMQWHVASRMLLGLPRPEFPVPDYVSSFSIWDPYVLRALLARIEEITGSPWMDAVTAQSTFSEWTIYGIFAEELMPDAAGASMDSSLCHSYWDPVPLTEQKAADFVSKIEPDHVAILIQSKSHTPIAVRRAVQHSLDFAAESR